MDKKVIFVLGSNSFSGSNFIRFILQKKFFVIAISRSKEASKEFLAYHENQKEVKFFKIDINKNLNKVERLLRYYKPKYFINFSAQGMVDQSWKWPSDWYQTNVISQIKLIEILKKFKFLKKYIHFTTPEVYGSTNKKIKENFNFNPSTPYAVSRASTDMHLKILNSYYNFPVIFTRAANIFGPYQDLYRIIPKTVISGLRKTKIRLHGGGESLRSFIYVDDVSNAIFKIMKSGKIGNTYHISTNRFVSIKNLVSIILKKLELDPKKYIKNVKDRVGKDDKYFLNSNKIRKELRWSDNFTLEKGIQQTINWIKKNNNFKNFSLDYIHKK